MIIINNFTKEYIKGKPAVSNLSLKIEDGDIYAFVGLNGAGKSTTIKSIVGILPFQEGEIYINGHSIVDDPINAKLEMAYVPDNPEVYSYMKGIDYVKFILNVYHKGFNETEMINLAKELEIDDALNNLVSSYSHGMKQKIILLAAFLHHPKVMILDEPFVGLDPKATFFLKNKMKEFADEGGTIFFSTHILEVAEKLCNKVAIIKEGKLVISGNMEDVVNDKSLEDIFLGVNNE